jgi:hypothetical protein
MFHVNRKASKNELVEFGGPKEPDIHDSRQILV